MFPDKVPRLPWREVDGKAVVINPKNQEVHELDTVGTFIWLNTGGHQTVAEIAAKLVEAFDVELKQAKEDTQEFLTFLESKSLIQWHSGAKT